VFISYSSKDAALAEELDELLRGSGTDTWIAPREILGGAAFPERIVDGITRTSALVVLVTASAAASRHVSLELNLAISLGKRILPLRIDKIAPSGNLQYLLALSQWLDVERPLAGSADLLIAEVNRLLDDGRPVGGPDTTLRGPASSVAQLHAERDAMVLGQCLAMVALIHNAADRDAALQLLPFFARKAELIADQLGTRLPATLFQPATVADFEETADFVREIRPIAERVGLELGNRHDRRAAHSFQLAYRVTIAALYVEALDATKLEDDVRVWYDLAGDVDLPRALLDDLADRIARRREPASACRAFGAEAALFLEDRLLRETEFARYRAAVWEMGCNLTLAAAGHAQGASSVNIEGLVATAELHGQALALRPPLLPARTGDAPVDGAAALNYMLNTLAKAFVDDIESLYGKRTSALLDAAVKSAALLILYGNEDAGFNETICTAIERALSRAAIPSDLWSELVTACREHRTYAAVKDLTFEMRKSVSLYLSDLVVMSRVPSPR
jgi:hypothetical protein